MLTYVSITIFLFMCIVSSSSAVFAAKLALSSSLGLNQTAVAPFPSYAPAPGPALATQGQLFWAGACVGTVLRAEAIPNRTFSARDGHTLLDPSDVMA